MTQKKISNFLLKIEEKKIVKQEGVWKGRRGCGKGGRVGG